MVVDHLVWERGGGWPSGVGERWWLTIWCGREVCKVWVAILVV